MKKTKIQKNIIIINRSSKTGKFVSEKFAKSHKSTTETEKYRKKIAYFK